MNKYLKIWVMLIQCVLLSGCWDSIEIEERAFTYGIAIDLVEKGLDDEIQMMLTNQIIAPSGFSTVSGGGSGEAYRNISRTGESIYKMNQDFEKQTNRKVNAQHLQVIVVSKELLEQPKILNKLFDTFIRGHEMRRGIKMAVMDGRAKDLFNIQPEHIKVPVDYISHLLEIQRYSETIYPLRIGDIQEGLINNMSFPLPFLSILDDKNVEFDGVAVYNSTLDKIVGNLSPEETKGLNLLNGQINNGTSKFEMDGNLIVMRNINGKAKMKLINKDKNNLTFQIDIAVNANLGENYGENNEYEISKFEKPLEETLTNEAEKTIKKLQEELKTDILGLNQHLKGFHYKLWKSVKDDWEQGENLFQKCEIKVKVDATMKNEGNAINTSEYEEGS